MHATSQQTGPLRTVLAHRAAVTRTSDDELRVWTVSQGTDAPLSVLDGDGRRALPMSPCPGLAVPGVSPSRPTVAA